MTSCIFTARRSSYNIVYMSVLFYSLSLSLSLSLSPLSLSPSLPLRTASCPTSEHLTPSPAFQEGLLDLTLLFSDGTRTPLSAVDVSSYVLDVDTLDPMVVALAPQNGQQPRVLAIGPGKGKLLKVRTV